LAALNPFHPGRVSVAKAKRFKLPKFKNEGKKHKEVAGKSAEFHRKAGVEFFKSIIRVII